MTAALAFRCNDERGSEDALAFLRLIVSKLTPARDWDRNDITVNLYRDSFAGLHCSHLSFGPASNPIFSIRILDARKTAEDESLRILTAAAQAALDGAI